MIVNALRRAQDQHQRLVNWGALRAF